MEKFVLEMAQKFRKEMTEEPPRIVELRSKVLLIELALALYQNSIINIHQHNDMMNEINKLYKK
jgi:hypothetical protein